MTSEYMKITPAKAKAGWVSALVLLVLFAVATVTLAVLYAQKRGTCSIKARPALAGLADIGQSKCPPCPSPSPSPSPTPAPAPKPAPGAAKCTPVANPPAYDLLLTWYGVQTDGPLTGGVVTPEMYAANARRIIDYMIKSTPLMKYTGILLHLDPPTAAVPRQGKPANFSSDIFAIADLVASVPAKYRVGFHAVMEADATWQINANTVTKPASASWPPGIDPGAATNKWFGGVGQPTPQSQLVPDSTAPSGFRAKQPVVDAAGAPYQAPFATADGVCPYKVGPGSEEYPADWPSGCPGNAGRIGWYCCAVNAILAARGSKQRVTMMNWDAEGNGPVGIQCTIFQFLWAVNQYATEDPAATRQWTLYQNGASGLNASAATYHAQDVPCGFWDQTVVVDPRTGAPRKGPTGAPFTYGDMGAFQAAPEYYWFNGEDMGSVGSVPGGNMLPSLAAAGYVGCPQSAPGKPGYDAGCGCRSTVYETYAHTPEGAAGLLKALAPLYDTLAGSIPTTTPTFSLEHLGSPDSTLDFGHCVNSANFCKWAEPKTPGGPNWACQSIDKCIVRCGVANFFGNWTQECFKAFLDGFAAKYGAKSIMVYDAGFIPATWLPNPADANPSIACPGTGGSFPTSCEALSPGTFCTLACPTGPGPQ
jgi:hypothetical protein